MATRIRRAARTAAHASPALKRSLKEIEYGAAALEHGIGRFAPAVIQPHPRRITIAITAYCNLRCIGCRYGRDFMPLQQLTLAEVNQVLDDAKDAGVETARLYGGEPLLHRDLAEMVRHAVGIGLSTYITTNGVLLREKIDALFAAGLRNITIGYYGTDSSYDAYTQRQGRFARLEAGLEYARSRYGSALTMQLNFLIMRPSCSLPALRTAWEFADRFDMTFHTDLIHYSLPYFTDGTEGGLRFRPEDEAAIREVVAELARLKRATPQRIPESLASIHSIPDWLLKGPGMQVPCDARKLIWIGADGTVQLCYVTFKLGNIRERRLRDILFTPAHRKAARDAFHLNCPHCHCERDERILKHLPSRLRYTRLRPNSPHPQ
ncbi:MAG: radical SAM/SPASM domain-containing protein [Acetobacteraceae bacterium]